MNTQIPADRSAPISLAHTVPQTASLAGTASLQDTSSTELPLQPFGSDEVHGARFVQARRKESTDLLEAGWTRRFTALGRRLEEAAELYRQLGFEVLLEPADPDEQVSAGVESCRQCFVTAYARTIYTRPCTTSRQGEHSSTPVSDPVGA